MNEKTATRGFAAWFAFCLIMALASFGLMAWAVIALVSWVTAQ